MAFLAQASGPHAISSWSVSELHSALGLKVRTKALSPSQAEAVLQGFERGLDLPTGRPQPGVVAGEGGGTIRVARRDVERKERPRPWPQVCWPYCRCSAFSAFSTP